MRTVRRILALFIICIMTFSLLAACGKKDGGTADSSFPDVNYFEGASEGQIALFGDLNGTKLRVTSGAELKDWEEGFYEQLKENTGMIVEIEPMGATELLNKISQAVASGDKRNYFDVAVIGNTNILQAIYGNLIIPMDAYIDRTDPVWKYSYMDNDDFIAPDVYKIDGKTWGSPSHGFHETFIFYNKTYFQEVGAPDPYEEYYLKDNWTFETFLDTCEAVTKKNSDGEVEVAAWASWNYFMWPAAAGNNFIEMNGKGKWEVIFDRPNGMAGLDVLYQSAINGWLDTTTSGYEEFIQRKIAMIIDKPSSAMGGPEAYSRMSDEIGMIPFPKWNNEQENYYCPLTATGYSIASCAQNPAGAAAWIYYHRLGEMQCDANITPNPTLRHLNEEAQARRSEYLAKCEIVVPMIEGLQGWYSGGPRGQFLGKIFKEHQNPSSIVDSMKGIVSDCLRKTVG